MEKKKKNSIPYIIGGVFALLVVFSGLSKTIKANKEANDSFYNTSKEYKIGDTVKCTDMSFTLDDVKFKEKGNITNGYEVNVPELVAIYGTFKNIDTKEIQTGTNQFRLINSNGEIIEHNKTTVANWGEYKMLGSTLAVGGTQKGFVEFANTNIDNSNLKLEFDCFDSSVGKYTFDLEQ